VSCLTARIFVLFAFCRAAANSGPDLSGRTIMLTAVDESPVGTKRTCRGGPTTSAVEGRTDMPFKQEHFRF